MSDLISQHQTTKYNQSTQQIQPYDQPISWRSATDFELSHISRLGQALALDPVSFERCVGKAFEQLGYSVAFTPTTGDGGVDLFIRKDATLGVVQCKQRYNSSVGEPVVRDLYGTMLHHQATEAYLVTTGSMTRQARTWCQGKVITLIDNTNLVDWLKSARRTEELQKYKEILATQVSTSARTTKVAYLRFLEYFRGISKIQASIIAAMIAEVLGLIGCLLFLFSIIGGASPEDSFMASLVCFIPATVLFLGGASSWYFFIHRKPTKVEPSKEETNTTS